jgi:hypothetical protein
MYSYEDRIRAVKLYIRLGKRLTATVRQLGYPTTKALERWYHTYQQSQDLPAGYICSKPKYSVEQKKAATGHYLSHGQCLAATVKAWDIRGAERLQSGSTSCTLQEKSASSAGPPVFGMPRN